MFSDAVKPVVTTMQVAGSVEACLSIVTVWCKLAIEFGKKKGEKNWQGVQMNRCDKIKLRAQRATAQSDLELHDD